MTTTASQVDPSDENTKFFARAEAAFRELFEKALSMNELQFAFSLMPEMRGCRAEGWNTAIEAQRAFDDYLAFLNSGELTAIRARVALAFYCHLAEASGFYEIPKNLLRVAGGGFHNPWPFSELVEVHKKNGQRHCPECEQGDQGSGRPC